MRAPHSFSFCDSVLFETTKAQVKLLECLSFSSNRQEPSIDFILSKDRLFGMVRTGSLLYRSCEVGISQCNAWFLPGMGET
ncbi:hypothetical protein Lalb_Chr00c06g0404561 [Lupinus albus]|uniref:Uncharacterized protein n=1 Tax=Lupinus albus TaxID=3870 RepID=A0A6A4NAQ2_LUPAL|nr:hypothetical protein Lalb_Chr00c06g0404561 [Lupinus albus]